MKKYFLPFVVLALFLSVPVQAGIPVIVVINLVQNIVTALEEVLNK